MVSMRTILSVASLVMFVGVAIFLLSKEDIVPPEVTASHVALQVDPLLDTRYTSGARKRNLESFGLPDAMVARTIDRMRRIEDRHTRKNSAASGRLCRPQCGRDGDVWADQPDSSAVQRHAILSRRGSGRRDALRVSRATGIEQQDWSQLSPISDVYTRAELSDGREEDATLMAIAAIMTGKESDLLAGHNPWEADSCPGRGPGRRWSSFILALRSASSSTLRSCTCSWSKPRRMAVSAVKRKAETVRARLCEHVVTSWEREAPDWKHCSESPWNPDADFES